MKVQYIPQKSPKNKKASYVKEYHLENDKEVSDYIALLAIFLQNGRTGIPLSSVNSNLTRANLYKAPRTKHFHQNTTSSNPGMYYQQSLGQANMDYQNTEAIYEDSEDEEDHHTTFDQSSSTQTPVESYRSQSFSYSQLPESFLTPITHQPSKNKDQFPHVDLTTISPDTATPERRNSVTGTLRNDDIDPMVFATRLRGNSVSESSYSSNSSKKFTSSFNKVESTQTKTNIFGQAVHAPHSARTHVIPDFSRTDTPTTHINKKFDLFRVNTPSIPFELRSFTDDSSKNQVTESIPEEPKTPVEQTGDYSSSSSAYVTPISNRKPHGNSVSMSNVIEKDSILRVAKRRQEGLESPFKTPERTKPASSDGRISKHRSYSSLFGKKGMPGGR